MKHAVGLPWFNLIFALLGSLVLLFIVAPLLGITAATSLTELSHAAADREVMNSVRLTLKAAMVATVVCAVLGVPLAYLLARSEFRGKNVVLSIIDLPIIIPHSAAGIALLTLVGRRSHLAATLPGWESGFVGTFAGIVVAMAFVSVPYLVGAARLGFEAVPVRLEKVARSLGASPRRVFFTISLPMAWRSVLSGMILMWARGISEFGAVVIIAYYPMTTPVLVFQRFNDFGLAYSRSAAVLLILICIAIFAILRFIGRQQRTEGM
ncbi:MAG: ABC transporter permease [Armatimonadetes bacterium]|nr:ABC transporter permease [Armatimonadota bacterium]